jgi:Uncharacterized conserved protein
MVRRIVAYAPIEQYRHNETGEYNADAHMTRLIMIRQVVVSINDVLLYLEPCHAIFDEKT